MSRQHVDHLSVNVKAGHDAIRQVRSIERPHEHEGVCELELRRDVLANALRRSRDVGVDPGLGKPLLENIEPAVLSSEVVAPLADAVRCVDGERPNVCLLD